MLTTRIKPKISVNPAATTKKSAARVSPLRVTIQKIRMSWLALLPIHATTARPSKPSRMRGAIRKSIRAAVNVSRSLPVYQNLSSDVTSDWQTRQDLALLVKGTEELVGLSVTVLTRVARCAGPLRRWCWGGRDER